MEHPEPSEYHEYYGGYIEKVGAGDILSLLQTENALTLALLRQVPLPMEDYCYASGKWSIKEVIGHVIDSERMFAYRALSFARCDPAQLPSFEQEHYARFSNAPSRSLSELADELESLRRSNVLLFRSFDDETSTRRGIASGVEFSVRALAYIIAGHEIHHRRVLEERYLPGILEGRA